jgi:hypothetical protein
MGKVVNSCRRWAEMGASVRHLRDAEDRYSKTVAAPATFCTAIHLSKAS